MKKRYIVSLIAIVSLIWIGTAPVYAQDQDEQTSADSSEQESSEQEPEQEEEREDALDLGAIVTTGVVGGGTRKFDSSVSVSDLSPEQIRNSAPRSTTEIFRNIPGIRSESSGGEGNANIVVRGLPLAAGGSRYVQLQEDGLPILAFGDVTFGTADQWLRADSTIDRIEAIRGGSASTFASNAPGAVINLISKTGLDEGGSVGITRGIDFDTTRLDFEYGGSIDNNTYFHVGGFFRTGEGPRDIGFNGEEGGQVKLNLTREFDSGRVRLYFKHLNDRTFPSFPQPFDLSSGDADPIPGFDGRDEALVSNNLTGIPRLSVGGTPTVTDVDDGIRALSTAVGADFEFDLPGQWTLRNKVRYSDNSGGFLGVFPTGVAEAENFAADTFADGAQLRFVGGANDGQIISDPASLNGNGLIASQLVFDVNLNDLSQFVNDFQLGRNFQVGNANLDVTFGYYKSVQQIETDWFFTFFAQEVNGEDAALIDILDAAGNPLSVNGFFNLGSVFNPVFDLNYDRDAVFGAFSYAVGDFTFDGSVRYEDVVGTGGTNIGAPAGSTRGGFDLVDVDVNNDGVITPGVEQGVQVVDTTNLFGVDYNVDYVSYSFGANYRISNDLAVFGRFSRGGVVNGDRLILGAGGDTFTPDGALTDEGAGLDIARQLEFGFKYRTPKDVIPGDLSLFVTGFYAEVAESNFDITEAAQGFLDQEFESFGVEFESAYRYGPFNLLASFTWTDSDLSSDLISDPLNPGQLIQSALVGNTPQRQADLIYQITPSFDFDVPLRGTIGANIVGTTDSFAQDDNIIEQPGFAQINLFLNLELTRGLIASFNVNNLTNAYGITEINDGGALPANGIIRGRSIPGRTISTTLRYEFF